MIYEAISLIQVLVFGAVFDVTLLAVVIVHVRCVSRLTAQISALEASTDILLESQRELNRLILALLSITS